MPGACCCCCCALYPSSNFLLSKVSPTAPAASLALWRARSRAAWERRGEEAGWTGGGAEGGLEAAEAGLAAAEGGAEALAGDCDFLFALASFALASLARRTFLALAFAFWTSQ